jgi:hypothetical protein
VSNKTATFYLGCKVVKFGLPFASLIFLGAVSAYANPTNIDIFDSTHTYNGTLGTGTVSIAVDVDQLSNGNYLWQYTVTNNSYNPVPGSSNGFSGFELNLPAFPPDLGNVTNPAPSWANNCCSGVPEEWDIMNASGLGIMPGYSGVFSFTSLPRTITNSTGWFHTWQNGSQSYISNYSDTPGGSDQRCPTCSYPQSQLQSPVRSRCSVWVGWRC